MSTHTLARVPVALLVEGACEFQILPKLVYAAVAASVPFKIPVSNAQGNGRLRKELETLLTDIVKADHPDAIIVLLDERDALTEGKYQSCAELRTDLQGRADEWLAGLRRSGAMRTCPNWVRVVLQCPAFEAWLTADVLGLAHACGRSASHSAFENADAVQGHVAQLAVALPGGYRKRPALVKDLARHFHAARIARGSRSFRKFWKEVLQALFEFATREGGSLTIHAGWESGS